LFFEPMFFTLQPFGCDIFWPVARTNI